MERKERGRELVGECESGQHDDRADTRYAQPEARSGVTIASHDPPQLIRCASAREGSLVATSLCGAAEFTDTGCMSRLLWAAVAALSWLWMPANAQAWGREGHEIISRIATRWIHPATAREAASLLGEGETLVSISTWADEIRSTRPESAPWHYINIPLDAHPKGRVWRAHCPPAGCVISAIEDSLRVLRDRSAERAKRAEALRFLVHFVGDLHQPLHTADRNDRGGNDLQVILNGQAVSLHWAWDHLLIQERPDDGFSARERRTLGKGSPAEWAAEAHEVARTLAYGLLPASTPATLSAAYIEQAGRAISLQLRRAGIRLARLLDRALRP